MPVHVTHVASDIKGGVDVDLSLKTVITGPPRSGKTAIVNAVELALTGGATEVAGRAVVKSADLVLSLTDGKSAFADAKLSDGNVSTFKIGGKAGRKGKTTPPATFPSDLTRCFPLWAVREALTGSAAAARQFLMQYVVGGVQLSDLTAQVPKPLQPRWQEALLEKADSDDIAAKLEAVLSVAKKRASESKAKAEVANEIAVGSGTGAALPPDESEIKALRGEVVTSRRKLEDLVVRKATLRSQHGSSVLKRSERDNLLKSIEAMETVEYPALEAELAKVQAGGAPLEEALQAAQAAADAAPKSTLLATLEHAREVAAACHDEGIDFCPSCGAEGVTQPRWAKQFGDLGNALEEETRLQRAHTEAQKALAAAQAAHAKWKASVEVVQTKLDRLVERFKTAQARVEEIGEVPDDAAEIQAVEFEEQALRVKLADDESKLSGLEQAAASWQPAQAAASKVVVESQSASEWKLLHTFVGKMADKYVQKGLEDFKAKVQAHMPPGMPFGIDLGSQFRFGLIEGEQLRPALSNSEWAIVTAAITSALIDPAAAYPQVIVPDDRGYDLDTIVAMCAAFNASPAQVLIHTTVPVGEKALPDGWRLISLW